MRVSSVTAVCLLATIVAVLSGCTSNPQGAQAVPIGSTIARKSGAGQLRYNSLRRLAVTERVIHSFGAAGDGYVPAAALLDVNGSFYGTTTNNSEPSSGSGTVFKIAPSGKESVLHSFDSADGGTPSSGNLIDVNGTLYGTTSNGGAKGTGTVFSITQSGKFSTVYTFGPYGDTDGNTPEGALINVNGTLYGTTLEGGTYYGGTVFKVTTTGHETVLYSFGRGSDGGAPHGGLININGTLYGTTSGGGSFNDGTVFSVSASGSEKVLYSFSGSPDGWAPGAGLTNVNGTMYGTTTEGGSGSCECGTVFSIDRTGKNEKVLYSFAGAPDGGLPEADLLNVNGILYGTTTIGGSLDCHDRGCGEVFSVTTSGQEAVLYSFKGRSTGHTDGAYPYSGLIDVKGSLYGTTENGGAYTAKKCGYSGCGTVFSILP